MLQKIISDEQNQAVEKDLEISGCKINLNNLTKKFRRANGDLVNAIDNMSLDIEAGEFVVLVGPSGCGKTTLLRCIAGLESPDSGKIEFNSTVMYSSENHIDRPPESRDAAMLFQSYALWPHMTVFDNVAYPLKTQKRPREEILKCVKEVLDKVQCGNLLDQYPNQISGGQQQRIALARALVAENKVVLFDEPLSNIDAKVRDELRLEILKIQRELGFTAIYVTHDQTEAMTLADKIIVLKEGKIAQIGSPRSVFDFPKSQYVANFMGTMNEIQGRLIKKVENGYLYRTQLGDIFADSAPDNQSGVRVLLGFRPNRCNLFFEQIKDNNQNVFAAEIVAEIYLGTHFEYIVTVGSMTFRCWSLSNLSDFKERQVWIHIPPASIRVLPHKESPKLGGLYD